jgi:hypothetical protein
VEPQDYRIVAQSIMDGADRDAVEKLLRENHELKRTRSEAEASARMAGYQEGQRDLRRSIGELLGVPAS